MVLFNSSRHFQQDSKRRCKAEPRNGQRRQLINRCHHCHLTYILVIYAILFQPLLHVFTVPQLNMSRMGSNLIKLFDRSNFALQFNVAFSTTLLHLWQGLCNSTQDTEYIRCPILFLPIASKMLF